MVNCAQFRELAHSISSGKPLTVVFINDTGFIGGAGVAHRRQIQSFLLAGHRVAAICQLENECRDPLPPRGSQYPGTWLGLYSLPAVHRGRGMSDSDIAVRIRKELEIFRPDLVIFGNLHWAQWPVDIIEEVSRSGVPAIAYLHDCHWLTGRCAYTGVCTKYQEGCDQSCPTADEYPSSSPYLIATQWHSRRRVFCGTNGVPLFANSRWMRSIAERAFHGKATVLLSPLGLDARLFSPIDRGVARRLLSLPEDARLILAGAVNLKESRKSGPVFEHVLSRVHAEKIGLVVTFGARSDEFPSVHSLGQVTDERIMPVFYSAADLMIHTAQEESFGQTLLEAAACGIPSVAFSSGGIVDIARDGENALTVAPPDADRYFNAVHYLIEHEQERLAYGQCGRAIVEREFTLECQYRSWRSNINVLAGQS